MPALTSLSLCLIARPTLSLWLTARPTLSPWLTARPTLSPWLTARTTLSLWLTARPTLSPWLTARPTLSPWLTARTTLSLWLTAKLYLQGVLLYGPPGTGKTLLARAVAHHTECTFIRVSGSELVQKFIGEGARMVRELFVMARYKWAGVMLVIVLSVYCIISAQINIEHCCGPCDLNSD